jgi:alpha-glucosidase
MLFLDSLLLFSSVVGLVNASPVYQLGRQVILPRQNQGPPIISIPSPVNHTGNVDACQGYRLTSANIVQGGNGVDGTLQLIGNCSAYGPDYTNLTLTVRYETNDRLRVRIVDSGNKAHVVPSDVAPWPKIGDNQVSNSSSKLTFEWKENPFSFKVVRKSDGDVLFDTTGQALIFEEQYLRVRSKLAAGSHLQGLGQHNDNFT